MKNVLLELRSEHQQILSLIETNEILKLIHFVDSVHHPKEENLLFPAMAEHPLLKQGGPRCMFFRGLQMDLDIYGPPRRLLDMYYMQGGPRPAASPALPWLSEQNPLSLPIDEHRLGHELSLAIIYLSGHAHAESSEQLLKNLCSEYYRLLQLHIEKEETCLFILAERILNLRTDL